MAQAGLHIGEFRPAKEAEKIVHHFPLAFPAHPLGGIGGRLSAKGRAGTGQVTKALAQRQNGADEMVGVPAHAFGEPADLAQSAEVKKTLANQRPPADDGGGLGRGEKGRSRREVVMQRPLRAVGKDFHGVGQTKSGLGVLGEDGADHLHAAGQQEIIRAEDENMGAWDARQELVDVGEDAAVP